MPRNLLATGLITPTTWEPANLGPEGKRLAELTLRSLAGIFRSSASDVYVCENPSILVTAADALGPRSRPLICTNGRLSAAAIRLLTRLAETGTSLRIRADDDTADQGSKALRSSIP